MKPNLYIVRENRIPRRYPDGYDVVVWVCIVAVSVLAALLVAEAV